MIRRCPDGDPELLNPVNMSERMTVRIKPGGLNEWNSALKK
jgi:hypothetical protein